MSDLMEQLIADLVKGAARNTRENGGPGVNIVVARENRGREEKLAMDASTLLGGVPGVGPHLAGLNAAARDNSMGSGFATGMGAGLGQLGGGAAGHALGGLSDNDKLQLLATLLGSMGGGALGSAAGRGLSQHIHGEDGGKGEKVAIFGGPSGPMAPGAAAASMLSGGGAAVRPQGPAARPQGPAKPPPLPAAALAKMHASSPFAAGPKVGALEERYDAGVKAACGAFGIKEAIAPALLGLARAALPAAKAVGNFATKNPIGQQMAGTAASMGVQKMMTPSQPQQPG